jgi:hypothetical protein
MSNNKQSSVDWFQEQIIKIVNGTCELTEIEIFEKAKAMHNQEQINLLKFSKEMCTPDAPIEYIIKEFNK